jgi:hypothetical protein
MARQWHTRDSMMLTEVMPSGGASLPTCANVSERVTGIEPALSAWEVCGAARVLPADSVTCGDLAGLSLSDRD